MTSLIIASAVILGVITFAFILLPVFRASALGRRYMADSVTGDHLAELLARRDAVYEAIRDVDFDLETGKLTSEDHRLMRERLTAEGVRILQELDRLMQADVREDLEQEIEREVAALRRAHQVETGEMRPATSRPVMPAAPAPPPSEIDKDTIACPACGGRVRAGAKFCTYCGTPLAVACPECGHAVSSDDRFCSHCGAGLSGADRPTEAVQVDSAD